MTQHSPADRQKFRLRRTIGVVAFVSAITLVAVGTVLVKRGQDREDTNAGQTPIQPPIGTSFPSPPPSVSAVSSSTAVDGLAQSFTELSNSLQAVVGLAAVPVGGGTPIYLGNWKSGPAWSTSKLPLVLAALAQDPEHKVTASMKLTITNSDNSAADEVWQSLGTPQEAASKMDQVLREAGDPTNVEYRKLRGPDYSAFGQTVWSLTDQATFMSHMACDQRAAPLLELMGQISEEHKWGIGQIQGSRFKGGWGPSPTDHYLVRQVGLLPTSGGTVAIAVAAEPTTDRIKSDSMDDGIRDLDVLANWISAHLDQLPAGSCA